MCVHMLMYLYVHTHVFEINFHCSASFPSPSGAGHAQRKQSGTPPQKPLLWAGITVLAYVQVHLYTWCPFSPWRQQHFYRLHYKSLLKLVSSPVPLSNIVHKSTPYMQASKKKVNNKNTQLLIHQ